MGCRLCVFVIMTEATMMALETVTCATIGLVSQSCSMLSAKWHDIVKKTGDCSGCSVWPVVSSVPMMYHPKARFFLFKKIFCKSSHYGFKFNSNSTQPVAFTFDKMAWILFMLMLHVWRVGEWGTIQQSVHEVKSCRSKNVCSFWGHTRFQSCQPSTCEADHTSFWSASSAVK